MPRTTQAQRLSASDATRIARDVAASVLRLDEQQIPNRLAAIREHAPPGFKQSARGAALLDREEQPFAWILVEPDLGDAVAAAKRLLQSGDGVQAALACAPNGTCMTLRNIPARGEIDQLEGAQSLQVSLPDVMRQPFGFPDSRDPHYTPQRALDDRVENVLFELHSDLRDIDGLHPDAALDELCKIILTKSHDDTTQATGVPRLQRAGTLCDEELAAIARRCYRDAQTALASRVRSNSGTGAFADALLCSSHALARIVEQLARFNLAVSPIDIKARAFQKVLLPALRAGLGQFFTPAPVIDFIVSVAQPSAEDLLVDPFAGSAHFLTTADRQLAKRGERLRGGVAIEKSERMIRVALTDLLLGETPNVRIECQDSLLPFSQLRALEPESADVILTNPPFGSLLREQRIAQLGPFSISQGRKSAPLEVLGLERCLQLLRPGGRLGIVLPDGLLANPGSSYVRSWLSQHGVVRAIVSLPIETFAPFGANVKTSVLFVRKRLPGEQLTGREKVFVAVSESVGYDATGRANSDSDLGELAHKANAFFMKESW